MQAYFRKKLRKLVAESSDFLTNCSGFGCRRQQKRHAAAPPPARVRRGMERKQAENWWVRIRAV